MGGKGAREKAFQFLREVPRLTNQNLKGLPKVSGVFVNKKPHRKRGAAGSDYGWGTSARAKQYFGPLGYESGATPIQRKSSFERSYNYSLRTTRQFPEVSLARLQLLIDTERLDPSKPIDIGALCGTKLLKLDPEKNQFGFNLSADEGLDTFCAKVNIEVQWASEQSIMAVERAGGKITTAYFDLHSVIALRNPQKFFESGSPIPRRLAPPADLMEFYTSASNRGYLADPREVAAERLALSQKYGYELNDEEQDSEYLTEKKEPRQVFYGLQPGWIVNLADREIYKPQEGWLEERYGGDVM